jgi:hypothetical protein
VKIDRQKGIWIAPYSEWRLRPDDFHHGRARFLAPCHFSPQSPAKLLKLEPLTSPLWWAMMVVGFAGVGIMIYRRKRQAAVPA